MKISHKSGMTLVELLWAVFILSVGIGGILLLFVNSMVSSNFAWDMTRATSHAEFILEDMQERKTLTDISKTDWNQWAKEQGLDSLPLENISVEFVEPTRSPLDVKVTVSWVRKTRPKNVILKAKLVK